MPSLTIEPSCGYLYSVRWSYTRPVVFAVTCGNGKILLYDLKVRCSYYLRAGASVVQPDGLSLVRSTDWKSFSIQT